ncbi:MAG TPA: glycosyl hydrolase, partial [Gemmatimonadales bacterium]|nr:glycosyl hydrolase [Gemmatimonadales bacterium]
PIVFSPVDPNTIFASSQHLFKTVNDGQTWERISPDLTRADPKTLGMSGGPITHDMNGPEVYGTIFTVAPSYQELGTIWTGSDDGVANLTRDGGKTWTRITPDGLPDFSRISLIEAGRFDVCTAYLAAKRYQLDDRAPYIYRTHDCGKTWQKTVTGIRADDYVHAVREDPKRRGLLYAGAEHGIYVSWDDGDHWQSLALNLPDVQVPDIVVEENDLVIATHGRSMWLLEGLTPIHGMTAEVAGEEVHLFPPVPAVRSLSGARFDYLLKKPADTLAIEILDLQGNGIRKYLGAPPDTARARADSVRLKAMGCDVQPYRERMPPRAAGLNSFGWDLRYPGSVSFDCLIFWGAWNDGGPTVPPGRYQVRLTTGGTTLTQPFEVRRDPRLKRATDADLRAEFDLARQVQAKENLGNGAVVTIRRIRDAIDDRVAKAPPLLRQGDLLKAKLTALEEDLYQTRTRSGQDLLNYPIRLTNRMSALRSSVEGGDARPTDAALVVFKELSAELDQKLAQLQTLLTVDLAALNRALAARHVAVIPPGAP